MISHEAVSDPDYGNFLTSLLELEDIRVVLCVLFQNRYPR